MKTVDIAEESHSENIVGKRENAGNQHCLFLHHFFFSNGRQIQCFKKHLSSVNAFNLNMAKILSSYEGLNKKVVLQNE